MKINGNTIFITGGGSGIGRGLAEALHKQGNQIIISGRRQGHLDEVTAANPGMQSIQLDVEDPASIQAAAKDLIQKFPKLNVLINNAGIMKIDQAENVVDDAVMSSVITTNLMGSIRMTSALIEHLKAQPEAAIAYVTSGLAFVPMAASATYSATKAALHSYAMSQRFQLRGTKVRVLEIAPPYVQTELLGDFSKADSRAMPLNAYIEETIDILGSDADEILVKQVGFLRNNPGPNEFELFEKFNHMMSGNPHE